MNHNAPLVQTYADMSNYYGFPRGMDYPSVARYATDRLGGQPRVAAEPYMPSSTLRPMSSPVGRFIHPWIIDSPSLVLYPNHLSRPLTRPSLYPTAYSDVMPESSPSSSPSDRHLVSASDRAPTVRLSRHKDSDRPAYRPTIGGPPKAVLGGPGGKTFDEMVKSGGASTRLPKQTVSSPFPSTPDPTPKKDSEVQRDILWNGRKVPVKIPPASHSPPNTPNGDRTLIRAISSPKRRKAYSPSRPVDEQFDDYIDDQRKSLSSTHSILKPSVLTVSLHPASYRPMPSIRSTSSASNYSSTASTRGLRPTAPEFQPKFTSSTSTLVSSRPRLFSDSSSAMDSVKAGIRERLRPDAQPFVPSVAVGVLSEVESSVDAKSLPAISRRGVSLDTTFDPVEYERQDKVEQDEGLELPGERGGHLQTSQDENDFASNFEHAKVAKTFNFNATAKPFISKSSPSTFKLGVPNPVTPINKETSSTRRNSLEDTMTSVAYSTVDGSPLIPRRILSDASSRIVLSGIDQHGSNFELGNSYDMRYNEQVILDDDDGDDNDVRPSNSNDQRFLDWVFPHYATRPKPPNRPTSISRRHTVPLADEISHDGYVLPGAGVASTSLATRVDDLRAALAERRQSSVEFPKRETKLAVVNITPRLEHTESFQDLVQSPDDMDTMDTKDLPERMDQMGMIKPPQRMDKTDMLELAQLMMKIAMDELIRKLPLEKLMREVQDMKEILSDVIQGTEDTASERRLKKLQTTLEDHGFVLTRLANQAPAGATAFQEILASLSAGQQAIVDGVSEVVQGQTDLLNLKISLRVAQDQVEHRDADLLLNRQAIEELQRDVRTLTAKLQEAEKTLWQVERGKDDIEKERDDLRSVVEKQLGEYAKTKTRLDEVESENGAVEVDRDSRASTVISMRQLLEDKERENETLRSEISMARERQRSIDAERVVLTRQLDDMSRVTTGLQTQMFERFDGLQEALREKITIENQMHSQQSDELRDKLDTAQRQIIELDHLFVSAQSAKMDLAAQISAEQKTRKKAEQRLIEIQHRLEVAEKNRMDAQMMAFERQASTQMSELRLQSLVEENHIWRSFALEADRNKFHKFIVSQPFSNLSEQALQSHNNNTNIGSSQKNEGKGKENIDHAQLKANCIFLKHLVVQRKQTYSYTGD
ncbi:hypothetical protein BCR39DRAFT_8208 [Naematelia encephala]|uniref:Uncharacterized protein n=1 Tax=Naematelia encephala TaxID=71784 RepID=A0A1Y2BLA5_9TREE|nr:hypothetical protein BCR39DRAFT_8208 [Naematelia encephala]